MNEGHPLPELGSEEAPKDSLEPDPPQVMVSGAAEPETSGANVDTNAPQVMHPGEKWDVDDGGDFYRDIPGECTKYSVREENRVRGNWTWGFELSFASVAAVCNIGLFTTVPFLMYANGGVVYLLAFTMMTVLLGAPLLYLEMVIGQFSSSGVLTCWEFFPLFKGIGVAMLVTSGLVSLYKSTFMAWVLYYLFESVKADFTNTALPWTDPERLQPECRSVYNATVGELVTNCSSLGGDVFDNGDGLCWTMTDHNMKPIAFSDENVAAARSYILSSGKPLSEIFFECEFVGKEMSELITLSNMGPPRLPMVIPALGVWLLVLVLLCKGVKSIGKVTMITAPVSLVILVALVTRALTLPGAWTGLMYYVLPGEQRFLDPYMWFRAGMDSIYVLFVSFGVNITYSSYSRFHTDTYRYMFVTCFLMFVTLALATLLVAGLTGFLAHESGLSVSQVASSGLPLIFIAMPEAFDKMPSSSGWCVMLYLMMTLISLGGVLGLVETVVTGIIDQFPRFRNRRWVALIVTCVLGFLLQLPGTTNGGVFWMTWLDVSINTWNLLFVALCECLAYIIYCCVSLFRFRHDVAAMTGWNCCCVPVIFTWGCQTQLLFTLSPISLFLMMYVGHLSMVTLPEDSSVIDYITWCMSALPMALIVITAIGQIIYYAISPALRMIDIVYPTLWRPALDKHEIRRQTVGKSYTPWHV